MPLWAKMVTAVALAHAEVVQSAGEVLHAGGGFDERQRAITIDPTEGDLVGMPWRSHRREADASTRPTPLTAEDPETGFVIPKARNNLATRALLTCGARDRSRSDPHDGGIRFR